ncbi:L,D-transpeptidase family protein [Peptoniphilaceae bacterium SGI.131]
MKKVWIALGVLCLLGLGVGYYYREPIAEKFEELTVKQVEVSGYNHEELVVWADRKMTEKLGSLKSGEKIEGVKSENSDVVRINYENNKAYIAADKLFEESPVRQGFLTETVPLYESKDKKREVSKLKFATKIEGAADGEFFRVDSKTASGFVEGKYVTSQAKLLEKYADKVIDYYKDETLKNKVGKIDRKTKLSVLNYGNTFKIERDSKAYFISKEGLIDTLPTDTRYIFSEVNFRKKPSTDAEVVRVGKMGEKLVGYIEGEWLKTTYEGQTVYVNTVNLTENYVPVYDYTGYAHADIAYYTSKDDKLEPAGYLDRGLIVDAKKVGAWLEVFVEGRTYYAKAENVKEDPIYFNTWNVIKGTFRRYDNDGNIYQSRWVGSNHIIINLSSQRLYYYLNGELVIDTGVVTGLPSKGWATPTGYYAIYAKETNRDLIGDDYKLPVEYWMPFHGDYGIHDVYYRTWEEYDYLGTYLYNGSHGCVNTPLDAVRYIYNNAPVGTPVTIID